MKNKIGNDGGEMQRTLFSIKTNLAADIRMFSSFSSEEELVLPSGTVVEVLNVKRMARCCCAVSLVLAAAAVPTS